MRILFSGGGTGGHIYPALAVAVEILDKQPQTEILFISGTREIERKIINDAGFEMKTIPVTGLPRKLTPALITFMVRLGISIIKSMFIIRGFRPSIIMATGGYVSAPQIMAAWIMSVPVVMQEQNSYPGYTTRKLARFADMIFLGFQDAAEFIGKKAMTVVTGNPVRKNIGTGIRKDSSSVFNLDPNSKTILVFGGSQGARSINRALSEIVQDIAEHGIQIIWQTGINEFKKWNRYNECLKDMVRILPYIENMENGYAASDLVVSRAGAMTIAEITACGLPGIFIPLPTAAENHQEYNARSLVKAGAASMIHERDLTPETLKREINGIINSEERLKTMSMQSKKLGRKDAASVIAGIITEQFGMN